MDIRTMQYYLAVVREGTISAAAEALHVAQPSLSRQMKELEKELGVSLFERGNRRITLTEEGIVLRKRAEEMVRLMQLTQEEVTQIKNHVSGSVRIGAGESNAFHFLSRTAGDITAEHPDIRFHITSGDTQDLMDELNDGLIDFALIFTQVDHTLYQAITLPVSDRFGILMPRDHILTQKDSVKISDLKGHPVILSRAHAAVISGMKDFSGLHVVATYNLLYNASLLVEDGVGLAVAFEGLIHCTENSALTFRPLVPEIKATGNLIWKKYQTFSAAAQLFAEQLRDLL
ncbi:MAG: LysR family transcriptional regulator [Clostridia bacterium]|nr:LysR family transcriptional regulator [Clostridia bacterium]